MTGEPGRLPGIDLAELAALIAPLVDAHRDPQEHAQRVAAVVVEAIQPTLGRLLIAADRIEAGAALAVEQADQARRAHRSIGPFIPPPHHTPN